MNLIHTLLYSFLEYNDNKEKEKVKFLLSQHECIRNVVCDDSNNTEDDDSNNRLIIDFETNDFENNEKWKVIIYFSYGARITFIKMDEDIEYEISRFLG
jgi:hypothetical protein